MLHARGPAALGLCGVRWRFCRSGPPENHKVLGAIPVPCMPMVGEVQILKSQIGRTSTHPNNISQILSTHVAHWDLFRICCETSGSDRPAQAATGAFKQLVIGIPTQTLTLCHFLMTKW